MSLNDRRIDDCIVMDVMSLNDRRIDDCIVMK